MLDDLLGALKQGVLQILGTATDAGTQGAAATAAGSPPTGPAPAGDPFDLGQRRMPAGETLDAVLPTQVGEFTRARVNDRFGGIRSGGVFAGYRGGGVEIRVLVSLLRNAGAARERVREGAAPEGGQSSTGPARQSLGTEPSYSFAPGSVVWSRGAYCFSASSSDTDGDIELRATAEQIAALDRFLRAFPY